MFHDRKIVCCWVECEWVLLPIIRATELRHGLYVAAAAGISHGIIFNSSVAIGGQPHDSIRHSYCWGHVCGYVHIKLARSDCSFDGRVAAHISDVER